MCGVFGIVLNKSGNVCNLIIEGLIQLQNRGYDSAGLCVIKNGKLDVHKYASTSTLSAIEKLKNACLEMDEEAFIGIGHNRWATHGIKNDTNAHPHLSNNKEFVIVHNGIIENYHELKKMLIEKGYDFVSQTDTEVIVNLIEYNFKNCNNMFETIQKTTELLNGTYGLLIQYLNEENKLYCVRNGSPLLIGQSENKDRVIVTSEQGAFGDMLDNYITLNNDDICMIERNDNNISIKTEYNYSNTKHTFLYKEILSNQYKHWTIKEINEQPNVVLNSINNGGRINGNSEVKLGGLEENKIVLKTINNLILLGCGTSYFAGLYGMYYFKQLCNFNTVQTFDGAEFNEYDIPKIGNTSFILISQSGETKDLHRCIEIAKKNKIVTIGIINVVDSLIAREVDCGIYCNAGKEVGVCSTKAFTSQVVCLSMAAIWFSQIHNINEKKREQMVSDLKNLQRDVMNTLEMTNNHMLELSKKIKNENMFLLGKGSDEYVAKEGALKIKEISYIHAEGYSSSSLKHGPFALLDENFLVLIINLDKSHTAKTINCYQEVSSRNAPIIFITNDISITNVIDCEIIYVPENKSYSSLLGIIPLQFLAYYLSVNRGINPDKPKNLAKVVTVE